MMLSRRNKISRVRERVKAKKGMLVSFSRDDIHKGTKGYALTFMGFVAITSYLFISIMAYCTI